MSVKQLRRELKSRIDRLPEQRLLSAADYLAYLDETSDPVALAMWERIRGSEQEIARGEATPIGELRRKRQ